MVVRYGVLFSTPRRYFFAVWVFVSETLPGSIVSIVYLAEKYFHWLGDFIREKEAENRKDEDADLSPFPAPR